MKINIIEPREPGEQIKNLEIKVDTLSEQVGLLVSLLQSQVSGVDPARKIQLREIARRGPDELKALYRANLREEKGKKRGKNV